MFLPRMDCAPAAAQAHASHEMLKSKQKPALRFLSEILLPYGHSKSHSCLRNPARHVRGSAGSSNNGAQHEAASTAFTIMPASAIHITRTFSLSPAAVARPAWSISTHSMVTRHGILTTRHHPCWQRIHCGCKMMERSQAGA